MTNKYHEANRVGWDAISAIWQAGIDRVGDWRRCHVDPGVFFNEKELQWLGEPAGRAVCVLGSGNNLAAFALAGMGADVTSVDISQRQLDIAQGRSDELGLSIEFVRADVTDLSLLSDRTFDLVYTGGHMAVWVSDLTAYYREAARILKSGGIFIVNEYHPIRRIWKESPDSLEVQFTYFDRGPHQYDRAEEVPDAEEGSLPSYEFHWTVSEFITTIIDSGCEVLCVAEVGQGLENWINIPLTGLPQSLMILSRKK